ncbi:MAG: GntR family transcriptional regulator [Albidovulum sp.]|nr:GntR family transcriptional regulator [Albidovulum sp.]MDE0532543.1 GntR family transcriptional regulator [Albidovulum sp.]
MSGAGGHSRRSGRPNFERADRAAAAAFRREGEKIVFSRSRQDPLWQQLSRQLEALIYGGQIAANSRIPSETALCEIFGVSRSVIRNSLASLATKGLVVKLPRKGIYVADRVCDTDFVTSNLNLFEDMLAKGRNIDTDTFELLRTKPDDEECNALRLSKGEEVVRVGRVFWIDGQPITCTRMTFPARKVPGFEFCDIEGRSILGLVREKYGRRAHRAERWFNAVMPCAEVVDRMGVPPDLPLIWIESITFETDGSPLEYYRAHYVSNTARIHISVSD